MKTGKMVLIFVLFLLGVPSIREFSLPIIVGIIAGTYSSICIASPLWYLMRTKIGKNRWVEPVVTASAEGPVSAEAQSESTTASAEKKPEGGQKAAPKASGKKTKNRSDLKSTKPKRGRNRR